jgi:DNA mismatch repair protein MutS2
MHQAGLRVPAAHGSRLPVFRRVMADIGDEQSIAQSLSTFSSHLRNIVRFVEGAGPDTLVLLDEVGAGTDPAEGSALAMAIVSRLLDLGATVAATTHYAELKTYAETHPDVTNAAVEFDVATLRPTYRLEIGLPGKSQAFAIAERLGLPESILADARSHISEEHETLEQTLASIQRTEAARAAELSEAQAARDAAEAEVARARSGTARARQEAGKILADARQSADDLLAAAEREVAETRRELARERRSAPARNAAAAGLEALAQRTAAARKASKSTDPLPIADEAEPQVPDGAQPRVGLWVRSRTTGLRGRVVDISGKTGRATLETDDARIVLPGDDLEVISEPASGPTLRDREAEEMRRRAVERVSPTIDLHGERVADALERLDAYLNDVLLAGLDEAVIVHGIGTGALRRAVRDYLAEHPRVRGQRQGRKDEGGEGATVALL